MIPHFEKMLYDNGPLLRLYAQPGSSPANRCCAQVCEETAAWLMREMQGGDGGYFSSIDADSEGEEGRFYVWQRDEVGAQLGAARVRRVRGALRARRGRPTSRGRAWHLHVARPLADVAARLGRARQPSARR